MSIAAKRVLMNTIASELGNTLTANQLTSVMGIVSASMEEYTVEHSEKEGVDASSEELLNAFLSAKEVEGKSPKTIERYRYIINRMLNTVNISVSSINVYHLRKYLMDIKSSGSSDTTIEGYRAIYCSFFGWLHKEGLLPKNPCANLGVIKCPKVIRKPFSSVELERLKEACTTTRDRTIINFLLSTGCRISEVCALNRDDIDLRSGECTVFGKGSKERKVYLNEVTVMLLMRYFEERTDDSPALFIGKGSTRMTPGGIRFALKTIEKKAKVENVHPHRFRRTLATNLIDHGMPIQEVAAVLGHDKIDTTMKYVYVSQSNVKNAYKRYA